MNRARFFDPVLLGLTVLGTVLGLLFILDAGYARSLAQGRGYLPPEFKQQLIYLVPAIGAYWLATRFHAETWFKASKFVWFLSLLSLIAVEVVGASMNGAKRWIDIGPIHLQPAEFAKLATILYLASCFANRQEWQPKKWRNNVEWLDNVFVPRLKRCMPALWVLVAFVLIEKEPDLGTGAVVAVTAFAMFIPAGVSRRSLLACTIIAALGATAMVIKEPYRLDRFINHAHRWDMKNVDDVGYQTVQSELGMANGAIIGVGPGAGRSKHVMPATTTDFIMATVGEEFGLFGSLVVLGAIFGLVSRLLHLSRRADSKFKMLVIFGVAAWIGIQSCVNVMMANGFLPAIGIPLPFISSGGSSLVSLWLAIGLCQAMLLPIPKKEEKVAASRHRWGNGRTRVSRTRSRAAGSGERSGAPVSRVPAGPRR